MSSEGEGRAPAHGGMAEAVRNRLVLYVHGFDPRGPGVVHALQREDAERESARPDREIVVGPRRRQPSASGWSIEAVWAEGSVSNCFVALRWDDIVRARWDRSLAGQATGLARWVGRYVRTGAMVRLVRASRTMMVGVLVLPLAVVAFCLAAALVIASLAVGLGVVFSAAGLPALWGGVALLLVLVLPRLWREIDQRVNLCWLGRGHLHMVELANGAIEGLDARIDRFADRLLEEVQGGVWDEVIVMGHSSGSIHAADMVGRALVRRPDLGATGTRVGLITLGHCMPGYSMAGPGPGYRKALAALAETRRIRWLDITAAADPGAGGAWSPLRHSAHDADPDRVERRSPKFHRALSPEAFRALKRDPMAYHFQYMRSSDDPGVYDWYRLAFGPEAFAR